MERFSSSKSIKKIAVYLCILAILLSSLSIGGLAPDVVLTAQAADLPDHLIINQVYGGGGKGETPLSHGFIELYNPTGNTVDLTGYQIGYMSTRGGSNAGNTNGQIIQKALTGTMPANTSYLIRCTKEDSFDPQFSIDDSDLEWDSVTIDNSQYQIILYQSNVIADAVSVEEDPLEGTPVAGISKQRAIRRVNFIDTDDNASDFTMVTYNTLAANNDTVGFEVVRPRCLADGVWGISKESGPVLINQVFGGGGKNGTPLSHSFIELYNHTGDTVDLTGYKIGYMSSRGGTSHAGNTDGIIIEKELTGELPPHTSYLIRCAAEETPSAAHFRIDNFDLEWNQAIDNSQYQVILYHGENISDAVSAGEDLLEGIPVTGISKQRAIRRVNFIDTNDNSYDFVMIAYHILAGAEDAAGYEAVRPRSLSDGPWTAPQKTEPTIMIHQVFGGGNKEATPLNYNFIELYNATGNDVDLSEYTIGYLSNRGSSNDGSTGGALVKKQLEGSVAAYTSYLIRCSEEVPAADYFDISFFDLEWDRVIDNSQYQVILYKGSSSVDGVSVDEASAEGYPITNISKQRAIRRIDLTDTNNNAADFTLISYQDLAAAGEPDGYEKVRPKSTADGQWGIPPLSGTVTIQGDAVSGSTLTANVAGSNNTGTLHYQWKAGGTDISGAVSSSYKLTDREIGKAITVTVTSSVEKGSLISAPTAVVKSAVTEISSVSLSSSAVSLKKGTSIVLKATISPANASASGLTWSSSNPKAATVSKIIGNNLNESVNASITAKGKGTTTITVRTPNGKTASCKVTVGEVKLNVTSAKMQVKQTTKVFKVKSRYPQNDTVAKWTSSKPSVASVSKNGKVTAKKAGTTTLTVTMKSNATAAIKLKVTKSAVKSTKITPVKNKVTLKKGKKHTIKVNRKPITANDKLTYKSSAPKIASVSKKGVVKAKTKGTAKITIRSASKKKNTVKITVK